MPSVLISHGYCSCILSFLLVSSFSTGILSCAGLLLFKFMETFLSEVCELFLLWLLWFICSGVVFACFTSQKYCVFWVPGHRLEALLSCCLFGFYPCPRALTHPLVLSLGWSCELFKWGHTVIFPSFVCAGSWGS